MIAFPKLLLLWTAFFMLIFGLPALFTPKNFKGVLEKFLKNSELIRMWGFIVMILGLLFLGVHQTFNNGRAMFFSIFGYASLLKGAVLMRWPSRAHTKYKRWYSRKMGSLLIGFFCILFAVFITRIAFANI